MAKMEWTKIKLFSFEAVGSMISPDDTYEAGLEVNVKEELRWCYEEGS